MSFYTALTGLNGSQADIAATSNNIAKRCYYCIKGQGLNLVIYLRPPLYKTSFINWFRYYFKRY